MRTLSLEQALDRLRSGHVIGFPTETVFGLGADATNPEAAERVFEMKGRPRGNPMLVLVADRAMAESITKAWTDRARALADAFWPGPLTLVCDAAPSIQGIVTAGGDTVAVRCPGLPALRELVGAFGKPIVAPSANRSGDDPISETDRFSSEFERELNSGDLAWYAPERSITPGDVPSTIVIPGDTRGSDQILRAGPILADDLLAIDETSG